jgi:F-type H+-transporting ATPase subunit c
MRTETRALKVAGKEKTMKRLLFVVSTLLLALSNAGVVMAAAEGAGQLDSTSKAAVALAAGLAIGIAAFGAALAQGRMAAAAMESIGRNPNSAEKIQVPMILGLAFIEALAIYALLIAFFLQGKI